VINTLSLPLRAYKKVTDKVRQKYGVWKTAGGYTGTSRVQGIFHAGRYVCKRLWQKLQQHSPIISRRHEFLRTEPVSRVFGFDSGTPIDRYYIEKFLAKNRSSICGHILEVADDTYARRFGSKVKKISILNAVPSPTATIVGDLATGKNIPQNTFNCVLLTQTLHCIYDATAALCNAYASLAPEGTLLLTAPGISQISSFDMERWGDYWRFTNKALELLIEQCCPKAQHTVNIHGNLAVAKGFLDGNVVEDYPEDVLALVDPEFQLLLTAVIYKPL
jgi:hypothetical protein